MARVVKKVDPIEMIAFRRTQEEKILRDHLSEIDTQLETLKLRRALVASLLGEEGLPSGNDPGPDGSRPDTRKCADCGAAIPAKEIVKNECPICTASPFEDAR